VQGEGEATYISSNGKSLSIPKTDGELQSVLPGKNNEQSFNI